MITESGKEYYFNGNIRFEGNYFSNKKWDGKGYNDKGKIIYKLENGKGKVKEYNKNGKLKFIGEYLDGKRAKGELIIIKK